jgi:TetR/AcrR family transcriptional regulator, fatty acid metabolism regulator protein
MRTRSGNKEQRILEAAVTVFAQDGYHRSKISVIAEEAGVAIGSVYVYFKNKEAILQRIFADLWTHFSTELEIRYHRKDLNSIEKLDAMIDLVFDEFIHNPDLGIVFVNEQNYLLQKSRSGFEQYYEAFLELGSQIVQDGMKKGLFRKDVDLLVLRHFTFGGIRHLIHLWARDPKHFSLPDIRASIKNLVKNSILRPA